MAQIPDRVQSWLWSVLQQYRHPRLAYSDIISAISAFSSLQPRTSVYTYEDGHSALLVCLGGTLPVDFRGTVYRYPVEIWVPDAYGERGAGLICYVKPGESKNGARGDFAIRPGQYVGVDGRIYHPYLRDWLVNERSNIVDFLRIAQDIFAKEPPIVSRPQQQARPQQTPPPPSLPPKPGASPAPAPTASSSSSAPPPVPAKPGAQPRTPPSTGPRDIRPNGPPLPPLPSSSRERWSESPQQQFNGPPGAVAHAPPRKSSMPSPLPPVAAQLHHQRYNSTDDRSPVSPLTPDHRAELPDTRYDHAPPLPPVPNQQQPRPYGSWSGPSTSQQAQPQQAHQQYQSRYSEAPLMRDQSYQAQMPQQRPPVQQARQQQPPAQNVQYQQPRQQIQQQQYQAQQQTRPQKPKAPDLLTDPFDISLPESASTGPAPPIPPNPEKEHLLSMLSTSLVAQATSKLQQNAAAGASLQAQNVALHDAYARLGSEMSQLDGLDAAIGANESILRKSIQECDAVIKSSKSMASPNIDEVLVAPTVASQQLWNLCADEAAIKEAMWCLQRAVGAGRVNGTDFVRLTRGLAREAFLKMVLIRKVATGLGLDVERL